MAGGTHGLDMVKQLRNNDDLRKLNYFRKQTFDPRSPIHAIADTPSRLSREQRLALVEKILFREKMESRIIQLTFMGICIPLIIVLVVVLFKTPF